MNMGRPMNAGMIVLEIEFLVVVLVFAADKRDDGDMQSRQGEQDLIQRKRLTTKNGIRRLYKVLKEMFMDVFCYGSGSIAPYLGNSW